MTSFFFSFSFSSLHSIPCGPVPSFFRSFLFLPFVRLLGVLSSVHSFTNRLYSLLRLPDRSPLLSAHRLQFTRAYSSNFLSLFRSRRFRPHPDPPRRTRTCRGPGSDLNESRSTPLELPQTCSLVVLDRSHSETDDVCYSFPDLPITVPSLRSDGS